VGAFDVQDLLRQRVDAYDPVNRAQLGRVHQLFQSVGALSLQVVVAAYWDYELL